ncbi:MAG TPA: hypothetical protein VJU59_34145 [Paraburkholderia sp.]|nr:hypothetical protein [Paraburkholderia sp.]
MGISVMGAHGACRHLSDKTFSHREAGPFGQLIIPVACALAKAGAPLRAIFELQERRPIFLALPVASRGYVTTSHKVVRAIVICDVAA